MHLETFALERFQSVWENDVAWNLSESGVHPLRVADLVDSADLRDALLEQSLGYPQTNGTAALRESVGALYPGASAAHVEITNGGSEANCVLLMHLVQPGDELVFMVPNYMQMRGLARGLGATVREWRLRETTSSGDTRWVGDPDDLRKLVTPATRAIVICNPNNPTGAVLDSATLDAVSRIAASAGAWLIADEIYRGAEREADDTPSVWGRYERAIVTSSLSKAYGLPGLRIGWVVAPPAVADRLWSVHDYTTIAPSAISDRLARIALAPERRSRLLARTRAIIRTNYPLVRRWIEQQEGLSHAAPDAGAIVFVRYRHPVGSTALTTRLREERSVLIVPGDCFEMDGYLRIGFGSDPDYLAQALALTGEVLDSVLAHAR